MFGRTRLTCIVGEPVVCVHNRVAKVFEDSSVKIVRSRTRRENDLPARRAAKLGRKRRRFDAEFLQGIDGNQTARSSKGTESLRPSGSRLSHYGGRRHAEIGGDTVHSEKIGIGSLSGDAELTRRKLIGRSDYNAWR